MRSPLDGARVLILRPEGQEESLAALLQARGAHVIRVPAVEIVALDPSPIDEVLARAQEFVWAIFTSANGVSLVAARGPLAFARIAVIGPATAEAVREAGALPERTPSAYTTEHLADELPGPPGAVVAFRAATADTRMDDALRARGFAVTRVDVYDTRPVNHDAMARAVANGIDAVMLTSASIARAFASATSVPEGVCVCAIGPATADACRASGLRVDTMAREHTIAGVVEALEDALGARA